MDAVTLHKLSSSRWFVPVLAIAGEAGGVRFAALVIQLGLSRSMLRRVLDQMIAFGWLTPNPGHGHPLRPEYLVAPPGAALAVFCRRAMEARAQLKLEPSDLGRWSVPVLDRLGPEWRRFSELEQSLVPITPRALSLTLKQLLAQRLIDRRLQDSFPPAAIYSATDRGRLLAGALS